jgi:hypothetical protein
MAVVNYFTELEQLTKQTVVENERRIISLNDVIIDNIQNVEQLQDNIIINEQTIENLTTEIENLEDDITVQIEEIVLSTEGLPRNLTIKTGHEFNAIICTGTTVPPTESTSINDAPVGSILVRSTTGWGILHPAPADGMYLTSNSLSPMGLSWFAV